MKLHLIAENHNRIDARIYHVARLAPSMFYDLLPQDEIKNLGLELYRDDLGGQSDMGALLRYMSEQFQLHPLIMDYLKELSDNVWIKALKNSMNQLANPPLENIKIIGKYSEADILQLRGVPNPNDYIGLPCLSYIADTNLKQFYIANDWGVSEVTEDQDFKIIKRY